ncbi:MAG: hypothetical protein WA853_15270 [Candidatus Acidiferrum sp.]
MLESKTIVSKFPVVVAEDLLVQIPEQMEFFHANVGAFELALEQAPEVFHSIGVNLSVNIFFGMVNDLMLETLLSESNVGHERIGVDRAACLDVSADVGLERVFLAIADYSGPDFAATFQHSHHGHFIFGASLSNPAFAFVGVHEASSTTNESFVHFDFFSFAAELNERAGLHRKANPVEHEPSGLLSHAERAANLIGTDAVLAVGNHPDSDKPLVERERRILKDSPDFDRELPFGVDALALPLALILEEYGILAATGRAGDFAIRPAQLDHEVEAVIGVREVDDGLLECFWLGVHVSHLNQLSHSRSDLSSILLPLQVFILKRLQPFAFL